MTPNEMDLLKDHHKLMVPEKPGPKPVIKTYSRLEIIAMINPLRRLFTSPYKPFKGIIKPGELVLDLGCGPGFYTIPMARLVGATGTVIARDTGQIQIDWLRKRAAANGLLNRIDAQVCTEADLGITPYHNQIQLVFIHNVMADVTNRLGFFKDVFHGLRAFGQLILIEPMSSFSDWHQWIRLAVRAGLSTLEPFDENTFTQKRKLNDRKIIFSKGKPLLRNLSE